MELVHAPSCPAANAGNTAVHATSLETIELKLKLLFADYKPGANLPKDRALSATNIGAKQNVVDQALA